MSRNILVALDQGTTSSRAIVFDEAGRILAAHAIEFKQHYPQPGWVEHDPEDILNTQITALQKAVELSGVEVQDIAAIGYISLGSLDNTVKAVKVDGVEATADNVKNGTYPICRPFNIATKGDLSDAAKDFIAFIQSDEGQQVITDKGCVSTGSTGAFTSSNPTGTVVIEGSSSVTPVMEKLAEAYMALNSGVTVKVQQSDSSTGMTSAIEGLCDIGMASREVKDSEKEQGLEVTTICMDGIAVVVNNDNTVDNLSLEQIRQIFTGEVTGWSAVK